MNHTSRAKGIVGRAFPRVVHLSDGTTVDVTAWHKELEREVTKGLRLADRDAWRQAIRQAANLVGDLSDGKSDFTDGSHSHREALKAAANRVLAMELER